MSDEIKIAECKVPLCQNFPDLARNWPICTDCMNNTAKRFMMYGMTRQEAINIILRDIDLLCAMEQKVIDKRGEDYDRDSLDDETE